MNSKRIRITNYEQHTNEYNTPVSLLASLTNAPNLI